MYAVIETGGKQYRVELNAELQVELTGAIPGSEISFDRVLLVRTDDTTEVGTPVVAGAKVTALVIGQERGVKTISFKYRPKARSRITKGHRQELHRIALDVFSGYAELTVTTTYDRFVAQLAPQKAHGGVEGVACMRFVALRPKHGEHAFTANESAGLRERQMHEQCESFWLLQHSAQFAAIRRDERDATERGENRSAHRLRR